MGKDIAPYLRAPRHSVRWGRGQFHGLWPVSQYYASTSKAQLYTKERFEGGAICNLPREFDHFHEDVEIYKSCETVVGQSCRPNLPAEWSKYRGSISGSTLGSLDTTC